MMKVLLDTHIILWALTDSDNLPQKARELITDSNNEIYYSLASAWEVAIKHLTHPNRIPVSETELLNYCKQAEYSQLAITENHILMLKTLHRPENAPKHNAPFDRMLIAQAKSENMIFVTHDSLIPYYNEPCVLSV